MSGNWLHLEKSESSGPVMSGGGMGRGLRKRNSKEISHSTAQNYRRLGIVLEKGIMLVLTVWKLEESLKNYIKTLWDPVSHFSSAAGIFHPSHSTAWVCALRRGWSKAMSPGTLGTVEGRGVIIGGTPLTCNAETKTGNRENAGSRGRLHETGWFKEGTVKDIHKMSESES